jgi:hypothetical protein
MSKRCRSVEARCRSGGLPGFCFAQGCRSEAAKAVEVDVEGLSKHTNFDKRREPTGKPTSAKSGGGFVPKPPRLLADYRLVGRNQVASTPSSSGAGPGPTYRPGHNRRKCDQPINRFLAFPDRLPRGAGAVEREVLDRPTVISSHSSLSEPVGLRADPRGARTD